MRSCASYSQKAYIDSADFAQNATPDEMVAFTRAIGTIAKKLELTTAGIVSLPIRAVMAGRKYIFICTSLGKIPGTYAGKNLRTTMILRVCFLIGFVFPTLTQAEDL